MVAAPSSLEPRSIQRPRETEGKPGRASETTVRFRAGLDRLIRVFNG
jgi:hypothetical protein